MSRQRASPTPACGVCGVRLGQGDKRSIAITSRAAVPDGNVTAVAVNITVTNPTATGFLTVYPKGSPTPDASNLNYVRGLTVANLVTAGVGPDGAITIFNSAGTADVIVDVTGWFEGTSAAQPLFDCAVVPAPAPASAARLPGAPWYLGGRPGAARSVRGAGRRRLRLAAVGRLQRSAGSTCGPAAEAARAPSSTSSPATPASRRRAAARGRATSPPGAPGCGRW